MNERTTNTNHTEDATPGARGGCDRAEQLVAHLYGEATREEQAGFTQHLRGCAVCRDELAAFRGVREIVSAERIPALAAAPLLDVDKMIALQFNEADAVNAATPFTSTASRRRSAVAAFREFFALAPMWLRAGAVACAALFCVLVALTLTRGEVAERERVVEKRVEVPVQTGFTREQVDALVAERLKEERAALNRELQQTREAETATTTNDTAVVKKKSAPRLMVAGDAQRSRQRGRTTTGNTRRGEQLAEDDLPRLSDLLGGAY